MARFVIGVAADADVPAVVSALEEEGASKVDTDAISRVGALVADFPDDEEAERRTERLSALPDVQYAEVVQLREQLSDDP